MGRGAGRQLSRLRPVRGAAIGIWFAPRTLPWAWLLVMSTGLPVASFGQPPRAVEETGADAPALVVDAAEIGDALPPAGRSLFDFVFSNADGTGYSIPFPFSALVEALRTRTGARTRTLLVPIGRSLQRNAANPDFFEYPRVVLAVDRDDAAPGTERGWLLEDRLFIGYQERAEIIEVISYNNEAARFEFQIVNDYRAGAAPDVRYAQRSECIPCHQNHAPLFSRPLWDETNVNADVAAHLSATGRDYYGIAPRQGVDIADAFDNATDRANRLAVFQKIWIDGCGGTDSPAAARCRGDVLSSALRYALAGRRHARTANRERDDFQRELQANWARIWPAGLAIPNPDIPNRKLTLFAPGNGLLDIRGDLQGEPLSKEETAALIAVPAHLEPFRMRAPAAIWRTTDVDVELVDEITAGLASFLAETDIEALDALLSERSRGARGTTYTVPCTIAARRGRGTSQDAPVRYRVACSAREPAGAFELDATLTMFSGASGGAGAVGRLILPGLDELRGQSIDVSRGPGGQLQLRLTVSALGLRARTTRGDAITDVTLRLSQAGLDGEGTIDIRIEPEFDAVTDAVDRMVESARAGGALAARPFRRAAVVSELFELLGGSAPERCCGAADRMPPARAAD